MITLIGANKGPTAVDSNLLVLLVVGNWNVRFIAAYKRLSGFNAEDFYLVRDFVASFQSVVTTPHVLAEVSNLVGAAKGYAKESIFRQLANVIRTLDERQISSAFASERLEFPIFGLTDAVLCAVCSTIPLLTADGKLVSHMRRRGLSAWTLDDLKLLRNQANDAG